MYTLKERIFYALKRHAVNIVAILAGALFLSLLGNVVWLEDNAHLLTSGILRVGLGTMFILLVTKFAFPKLSIQEKINEGNTAVAIFAGLVAVAIAQLF